MESFELPIQAQTEAARESAHSWLAQFAPILEVEEGTTAKEVRGLLQRIRSLRDTVPMVRGDLVRHRGVEDGPLLATLERAIGQLDSLEDDLRRRLGRLEPGAPESLPDLVVLQDRLAEREARQEIGVPTEQEIPAILEIESPAATPMAGVGLLIFGLGWTSFTLLHSVLMIGGMWAAMGPIALALLLFYAIFYAVGLGMLAGAFRAMATEKLTLNGFELIVRHSLGPITFTKRYQLGPESRARLGKEAPMMQSRSRSSEPAVVFEDASGRTHAIGHATTERQRQRLVEQINAYLAAQA